MPSLLQTLSVRLAFGNPRAQAEWLEQGGRAFERKDQVREYLSRLDIHKSVGCDEMHPWVLRKLADVIARSFYNLYLKTGEKQGEKRLEGGSRELQVRQPVLHPWEGDGIFIMETIPRYTEEKKIIQISQHSFTKGKSCLTIFLSFCNEITSLMNRWRAVDYHLPGLQWSLWHYCPKHPPRKTVEVCAIWADSEVNQ